MEEIRTFLDAEDVVTARWLAMNLSIKVNKAYSLLKQYHSNASKGINSAVKAFYLLSGSRGDGSAVMLVVSEDMLEARKKSLQSVTSCEIYSLQRDNRSNALPGMPAGSILQLYFADSNHEYMLLSGAKPGADAMLANKAGRVQPGSQAPRIVIKPAGERVMYSGYTAPRATAAATPSGPVSGAKHTTTAAAAAAQEEPLKASKKSTISAGSFFSSSAAPSAPVPKAKANGGGLFGQKPAAAAPAAATAKPASPVKQAQSPKKSPKRAKAATTDEGSGSDAEWDDGANTGANANYKPNKDNLKKRKVALGMPDGTGGLHQADVEKPEDDDMNVDPLSHHRSDSPKRSNVNVHGAIDDWRDDAGEGPPKKRTKIKTVEKMLMDDRGYMITTLVEEEVTDDEDPAAARAALQAKQQRMSNQAAAAASASTDKPKSQSKAAGAAKKAAPAGQKGMMSFFGKG